MVSSVKVRVCYRLLALAAVLFLVVPWCAAEDGLYILEEGGRLHRVGNTPAAGLLDGGDGGVDFELSEDGHGIYMLDPSGSILSEGAGLAFKGLNLEPQQARRIAVSRLGFAVLDDQGQVHFGGGQPPLDGDVFFGWDIAQDIELTPEGDGMVALDRFGGLHYWGEAPRLLGPFFGWDIARDVEFSPDGQGYYVLDGFGFIHSVGPVQRFAGRNLGWDIARDLELTQSGQGYYILDGFGCLHIGGDAIPFDAPFFGWDVALDLEIAPRPMGALSGKVLDGNSPDGLDPIAGAVISLVRMDLPGEFVHRQPGSGPDGPRQALRPIQAESGSDGTYRFEAVPAGSYAVTVSAAGYDDDQGEVEVLAGQEVVQDFVLFAQQSPPPPGEYGSVVGTVVEDTGALTVHIPIPNARVSIHITHRLVLVTRTNEQGEFEFPRVPVGSHLIRACAEGYFPACDEVEVEAESVATVQFRLLPRPSGAGRVFGKVWYDSLVDCAPGADCIPYDVPIPGAHLHLIPKDLEIVRDTLDGANLLPEPGAVGWHTISDASGLYEFNEVPCGSYVLAARAEGFAPAWVDFELLCATPEQAAALADSTAEPPCEIEIDVQMFPLVEEFGSIFGTVRGASTSSLLGAPLPGAVVHAIPLALQAGPGRWLPDGSSGYIPLDEGVLQPGQFFRVTDENGDYRFEQLPAGRYQFIVTAEGYQPSRREVFLPADEELEENFVLLPILHPTGRIEGIVAGEAPQPATGEVVPEPIEGAVVVLVPAPRPLPTGPDDTLPVEDAVLGEVGQLPELLADMEISRRFRRVTTAADGSYAFEDVPVGHYRLVAKARGYLPQCQPADVFEDATTTVNFLLRPLPPIRCGALVGSVTDVLSGDPVARAVVTAWPLNAQPLEQPQLFRQWMNRPEWERPGYRPLRTVTDDNGDYEFPRLPVGPYRITVRAQGYEPAEGRVRIITNETAVLNFGLQPLPPAGGVFGQVCEQTGDEMPGPPIPGALVTLIPWDVATAEVETTGLLDETSDPAGHIFRTRTNLQGEYELPHIPAGRYLMRVQKYGFEPARRRVVVPPGASVQEDFALRPVGPPPSGTVVGAVYALSATATIEPEPIEGALVSMFRVPGGPAAAGDAAGSGRFFARTNEAGEYEFDEVPAGSYLILVYARGYEPDFRIVDVLADEITQADFFLRALGTEPEGRIFGYVWEAPEPDSMLPYLVPIPGAHMVLFRWPAEGPIVAASTPQEVQDLVGMPWRTTWTNEEGLYEFTALPAGQYILFALKAGFEPASQAIVLPPGGEQQVDFQLERWPEPTPPENGCFEGRVWTANPLPGPGLPERLPVPGANVGLTPDSYTTFVPIGTLTDERGHFRFPNLIADGYTVRITKEGFEALEARITVVAGEVLRQDYELIPAGVTTTP